MLRRLTAQGASAVSLCIGATRHFRALHAIAASPGGAAAGIERMRPPIFGPRRDRLLRQSEAWGLPALEAALAQLVDADLGLRSSTRAPAMAMMERTLIRIARLRAR